MVQALVILGNQLFPDLYLKKFSDMPVFMAEDRELCTYFKFHKHKIVMFLSAMRHFSERLSQNGFDLDYHHIDDGAASCYIETLENFVKKRNIDTIHIFEIEDKFMETRIVEFSKSMGLELKIYPSPMFTCSRKEFLSYLHNNKKPFMKTFYEDQRQRLDILMEDEKPVGGKYSYDKSNRRKLPKDHVLPKIYQYPLDTIDRTVIKTVDTLFPDHPGDTKNYWLPTTRQAAWTQFKDFLKSRLKDFGPYQDAISSQAAFMHHSLISPALNMGLLTPMELVEEIVGQYQRGHAPLESAEGFIRQLIGWREFVRGIYQNYSEKMARTNYWNHQRQMKDCWYTGQTGLPPLDDAIHRCLENGYNHHIERLMIIANMMNLCEIQPKQVYAWFMEMYVDSSDWVMAANVYGMGLMSDGGIFATKPYISGSNYILKMSDYKKDKWCDVWDGLYWRFVAKHAEFFESNPRMRMMNRTLQKMDAQRKESIFQKAEAFIAAVTKS